MGGWFLGGSLEKEGGGGGLVMDFYVLLSIGWDFSLGFFLLFFFSFFFGSGGMYLCISFLAFCPFLFFLLPFSASSLFLMKTTSDWSP